MCPFVAIILYYLQEFIGTGPGACLETKKYPDQRAAQSCLSWALATAELSLDER